MFLSLLLEQSDSNKRLLIDNGFKTDVLIQYTLGSQFLLYIEDYSAFVIGLTKGHCVNSVSENLTRIIIEPSQVPELATLFRLGIYGKDLIPYFT